MNKQSSMKELFIKYWLTVLIAMQPVLDILAYWTRSPDGTAAGGTCGELSARGLPRHAL